MQSATLFGSYATGCASHRSDVDILVDSGLKGIAFFGLLEQVSEALRLQVDLIDICEVDEGSRLLEEVASTGVVLYERER